MTFEQIVENITSHENDVVHAIREERLEKMLLYDVKIYYFFIEKVK